MKKLVLTGVCFAAISLLFNGCYYDKEAILYPAGTSSCDTTVPSTFTATVMPILNANCNVCHGGTGASGGGIVLDNYNGVKAQVNAGRLAGAINHDAGYIAMPQGADKLPPCTIAKIQQWISAGAPNN
jgi:hypothetical protein